MPENSPMSRIPSVSFNLFQLLTTHGFGKYVSESMFELDNPLSSLDLDTCESNWGTLHGRVEPILEEFSSHIVLP